MTVPKQAISSAPKRQSDKRVHAILSTDHAQAEGLLESVDGVDHPAELGDEAAVGLPPHLGLDRLAEHTTTTRVRGRDRQRCWERPDWVRLQGFYERGQDITQQGMRRASVSQSKGERARVPRHLIGILSLCLSV
jgi:hypothetical protein